MRPVLVSEDDEVIREGVCLVLDGAGYAVLEAASGEQALAYLRVRDGLVVVLD